MHVVGLIFQYIVGFIVFCLLLWFTFRMVQPSKAKVAQQNAKKAKDAAVLREIKCPTCNHTGFVSRVATSDRIASGAVGGVVFSRQARAQFRCVQCGYLW